MHEIAFENVICKMASILSRPQWVKWSTVRLYHCLYHCWPRSQTTWHTIRKPQSIAHSPCLTVIGITTTGLIEQVGSDLKWSCGWNSVVAVEAGETSGIGVGIVTLQSELGSMLYGVDQGPASEYFNINSLTPCDVIWHHRTGSSLVQVMACCLTASWHMEAEAKWLPVCIKHFQIDSIETQLLCFIQITLRMFLRFILIRLRWSGLGDSKPLPEPMWTRFDEDSDMVWLWPQYVRRKNGCQSLLVLYMMKAYFVLTFSAERQ